jgi:hypothetical protein
MFMPSLCYFGDDGSFPACGGGTEGTSREAFYRWHRPWPASFNVTVQFYSYPSPNNMVAFVYFPAGNYCTVGTEAACLTPGTSASFAAAEDFIIEVYDTVPTECNDFYVSVTW